MRAGVYDLPPLTSAGPATQWGQWVTRSRVEVFGDTSGPRRVFTLAPLVWREPDGRLITVPEAFCSDGASLPACTWWLMGGRLSLDYLRAALVHNWYCARRGLIASNVLASDVFYRGLRADGMGFNRARLCYHATATWGPQWTTPASTPPGLNLRA